MLQSPVQSWTSVREQDTGNANHPPGNHCIMRGICLPSVRWQEWDTRNRNRFPKCHPMRWASGLLCLLWSVITLRAQLKKTQSNSVLKQSLSQVTWFGIKSHYPETGFPNDLSLSTRLWCFKRLTYYAAVSVLPVVDSCGLGDSCIFQMSVISSQEDSELTWPNLCEQLY